MERALKDESVDHRSSKCVTATRPSDMNRPRLPNLRADKVTMELKGGRAAMGKGYENGRVVAKASRAGCYPLVVLRRDTHLMGGDEGQYNHSIQKEK